jgi:peptidoglycan/xylan/chitin deacetylase (PgdA/CDA1 family)
MTACYVDLALCAQDGSCAKNLRVKANTGSRYTRLPGSLLRELGWEPDPYDLPWGWPMSLVYQTGLRVGEVKFRIEGEDYSHSVIFGADNCEPTLGDWSARGYVFEVDQSEQCVTPMRVIYL